MEHPYLFLVKLFEAIGLGHFAHAYPHVIYSWFVILLLIVFAVLATRKIEMIPTKAQNFFELVISGMEEFMVCITGDEGRWFFPIIATLFIYIAASDLIPELHKEKDFRKSFIQLIVFFTGILAIYVVGLIFGG